MKRLLNSCAGFIFTLLTVISCSPCADVVCNNGFCYNGHCRCEHGYGQDATSTCVPFSSFYITEGEIETEVEVIDSAGNYSIFNEDYNVIAADTNPFEFILVGFDGMADNDIVFRTGHATFFTLEERTVITAAGKTYACDGAKITNLVQLRFKDTSNQTKYIVTYFI